MFDLAVRLVTDVDIHIARLIKRGRRNGSEIGSSPAAICTNSIRIFLNGPLLTIPVM